MEKNEAQKASKPVKVVVVSRAAEMAVRSPRWS
jgi:hypothetical protein